MPPNAHVDAVAVETRALAAAVARDPGANVARYPSWSLADLGRHVGAIHRWVVMVIETRATARLPQPDVQHITDDEVSPWLERGGDELAQALRSVEPSAAVWTFSPAHDTAGFWHRRMAVETTLHRWDAEAALGDPGPVADWLAVEAIDEALAIYCLPRLAGTSFGGTRLRLVLEAGSATWSLRLQPDGLVLEDSPGDTTHDEVDAVVRGTALDIWLLLGGRRGLDALDADGDRAVARLFVDAVDTIPGPA